MILLQDLFKEGGKYEQTFVVTRNTHKLFEKSLENTNRLLS